MFLLTIEQLEAVRWPGSLPGAGVQSLARQGDTESVGKALEVLGPNVG